MVNKIIFNNIKILVFDFDGVFTNNKLILDENGLESVFCDRAVGLALDLLRAFERINKLKLDTFILSTETNQVVKYRAKKIKLKVYTSISNKLEFLENYFDINYANIVNPFDNLAYLGNDLNDLPVMRKAGISAAPMDAHPLVKNVATKVYPQLGGCGFVRAFIEDLININKLTEGELDELIFNR
jgi:YrbI family 3-deoxy-D-manno-octulosonate 8-phosphate phosphatase